MSRAASSGSSSAGRNRHSRARPHVASRIRTFNELQRALRETGMSSLGVIFGIDFTESNSWTGRTSSHGENLHRLGNISNPYQEALLAIWRSFDRIREPLPYSDQVNRIHCFGFGGAFGQGEDVLNLFGNEGCCARFEDVLRQYEQWTRIIELAEPTSFAPIIERAIRVVERSGGHYHVLLIITDGQVSNRRVQETAEAIARASEYPLSIIGVGVGDGPWDMMREFARDLHGRLVGNFQFVNFTKIMRRRASPETKLFAFARKALKKLPSQWRVAVEEGLLGARRSQIHGNNDPRNTDTGNTSPSSSADDNQLCEICYYPIDERMAFQCGHQTCGDCADRVDTCPFCRAVIAFRIRLYD